LPESFLVSFQGLPIGRSFQSEEDDVIGVGHPDLPEKVTHAHGAFGDAVDLKMIAVPG
jgi:hypothetical protein